MHDQIRSQSFQRVSYADVSVAEDQDFILGHSSFAVFVSANLPTTGFCQACANQAGNTTHMDTIANMLTSIRNAQAVRKPLAVVPFSKVKLRIAQILEQSGYLSSVERITKIVRKTEHPYLQLALKYDNGVGAISGMRQISKLSRHLYARASALKTIRSGFGIGVVSTSKGIMTNAEARKAGIGGELMFEIW